MRVLHVIADLGTYGAERLLALLLNNLREPGLELAVMTVYSSPAAAASLDVPVLDVARRGRYDVGFVVRMIAMMRAWQPDVVHTHMHNGKYWGRIAAIAAGVRTIVHTEHNSEFGAPAVFRVVNRALIGRTDSVVAFSQTHRSALAADESIPLERIAVIPNGIELHAPPPGARDLARAAMGAGENERIITLVGRLSAVKNQRLAIETTALLEPRDRLVFIGDGVDREPLEALARERGVSDRVTFLGFRDDAASLVAGADVALVTSHNEAMPLAVIEAMVSSAPIVSTPWNGAREMLGEGAYGVVTADYAPASVAAAVRGVLADTEGTALRVARAREFALGEYDIATTARRHVALYRELTERSRSTSRAITAARS